MLCVKNAIEGCSTGQIDGLSNQLLERLLNKGYLQKLDHPLIICQGRHNNPYLQPLAAKSLIKTVEAVNKPIHISSCLRTIMQQYMLREQYFKGICGITAAAVPGKSNHQSGLAIDVRDYLFWREFLLKNGWFWLGAWDRWHFDFKYGGMDLSKIQIQEWQELWNENNPTKKLKVDGIWGSKTANTVANAPIEGFNSYPTFKLGDINKEVGKIQILLRDALNLTSSQFSADCKYGAQTTQKIMLFQKLNQLKVTGICDRPTLNLLGYAPI